MKHLYVHVPFCEEICGYCDFFRVRCHDGLIEKWLGALEKQLAQYIGVYEYIDTIYVGGGTPSSLNLSQLARLLELLMPFAKHIVEYSFEANPESMSKEKAELLHMYGVNRISLGVQTLDDEILHRIHRNHRIQDVLQVIDALHLTGIHNISIDMMYGLPDQTKEMWVSHLHKIASWPISHVSIYALTIEEHSEFGRQNVSRIDNDSEGEMYELGIQVLEQHGFAQYEVSNFAKQGKQSNHNIGYWMVEDYLGVGGGAHGSLGHIRFENTSNINDYIQGKWISSEETITCKERMFEVIMLGLRMNRGVDLQNFYHRFHVSLLEVYRDAVQSNVQAGLLVIEDGFIKTTKKGMQLLHTVLLEFMVDET